MINLQPFCLTAREEHAISGPFSRGSFTYATDGRCIVRVPRRDDVPEKEMAPDVESKLPWNDSVSGPGIFIPDLPEDWYRPCEQCEGTGKVYICPECEGSGVVSWQTKRHEYEVDCEECDGYGKVKGESNAQKCDKCDGTGKIKEITTIAINGVLYNKDFLVRLQCLPEVILFPSIDRTDKYHLKPLRLTFDGGVGFVMPINISKKH